MSSNSEAAAAADQELTADGLAPGEITVVGEYHLLNHRVLGVGGFGKVYLGTNIVTQQNVAIKVILNSFVEQYNLHEYVRTEIRSLQIIRHAHVVRLLKVIEADHALYLVTELACRGELFDKIVLKKFFAEDVARRYFQQIVSAVHFCHTRNICHRDLKAENLLLDGDDQVKVCDFGLSRVVFDTNMDKPIMLHSLAGSTDYIPPEVIVDTPQGYDGRSADLWSCAVILCFMLSGYLPFTGRDDNETEKRIMRGEYRLAEHVGPEARAFISLLLSVNPKNRLDVMGMLTHPWFICNLDETLFPDSPALSPRSPRSPRGGKGWIRVRRPSGTDDPAQELRRQVLLAFDNLDVGSTGYLGRAEIRDVLVALNNGNPVEEREVGAIMGLLDSHGDGKITRDDFVMAWTAHHVKNSPLARKLQLEKLINLYSTKVEAELHAELRRAFDAMDTDHSGTIDRQEIRLAFQRAGVELSEKDAAKVFDSFNCLHNATDGFTFEEFVIGVTQKHLLVEGSTCCGLLRKLNILHGLVERESHDTLHNRGGFFVRGLRDMIQKSIQQGMKQRFATDTAVSASGLLHAVRRDAKGRIGCEVNIVLAPAGVGYTKVDASRLSGTTLMYHELFRDLLEILKEEKTQADDDLSPVGAGEEI
eukprot:PhM_4_TR16377/c0_g1_i1/m.44924